MRPFALLLFSALLLGCDPPDDGSSQGPDQNPSQNPDDNPNQNPPPLAHPYAGKIYRVSVVDAGTLGEGVADITPRAVAANEVILELRIANNGQMDIYDVDTNGTTGDKWGSSVYFDYRPQNPGAVGNDGSISSMNVVLNNSGSVSYLSTQNLAFDGSDPLKLNDTTASNGFIAVKKLGLRDPYVSISVKIVLTNS